MRYGEILPAVFLSRPNRFIAHVLVEGEEVVCHVKNTGRCRELLRPEARVWLEKGTNPKRKTAYDLVTVEKGHRLVNMDAQAPNKIFGEWALQLEAGIRSGRRWPLRTAAWIFCWKRSRAGTMWRSRG